MVKIIIISLPVTDLGASTNFYESLGFVNKPNFSSDTNAFMVWSETINVMLLTHEKWREFTTRPIPPPTSSEVAMTLTFESRDAVDAVTKAAAMHGGTIDINPVQDHGFMYTRDITDPDGHAWGMMWMDPAAIPS